MAKSLYQIKKEQNQFNELPKVTAPKDTTTKKTTTKTPTTATGKTVAKQDTQSLQKKIDDIRSGSGMLPTPSVSKTPDLQEIQKKIDYARKTFSPNNVIASPSVKQQTTPIFNSNIADMQKKIDAIKQERADKKAETPFEPKKSSEYALNFTGPTFDKYKWDDVRQGQHITYQLDGNDVVWHNDVTNRGGRIKRSDFDSNNFGSTVGNKEEALRNKRNIDSELEEVRREMDKYETNVPKLNELFERKKELEKISDLYSNAYTKSVYNDVKEATGHSAEHISYAAAKLYAKQRGWEFYETNEGKEEFKPPKNATAEEKKYIGLLLQAGMDNDLLKGMKENKALAYIMKGSELALTPAFDLASFVTNAKDMLNGKEEIDPLSASHAPFNQRRKVYDTFSKEQAQKWFGGKEAPIIGNVGVFVDGAVTSAIESGIRVAFASTVGQGLGLTGKALNSATSGLMSAMMGSSVVESTIVEEKLKGASDGKAILKSVAAGAIEAITEKYSIEAILGDPSGMFKAGLKAFIAEGTEEVSSNILNRIVDSMINPGSSDIEKQFYALVNSGMSAKEALNELMYGMFAEDFSAFLAGGLSGIAMGGTSRAMNALNTANIGNQLINDGEGISIIDKALGFDKSTEAYKNAEKLTKRMVDGKNISGYQIGKLAQQNSTQQIENLKADIKEAVKGEANEVLLEKAITKTIDGEKLTNAEEKAIKNSDKATTILASIQYTGKIDIEKIKNNEYNMSIRQIYNFTKEMPELAKNAFISMYNEGQDSAEYVREMNSAYNLGTNGKALDLKSYKTINYAQARASYLAGLGNYQKGADINVQNNRQSGKRNVGIYTGGQIQGLESDARQDSSWREGQYFRGNSEEASRYDAGQVTAKSLGIETGTDTSTVTLVRSNEHTKAIDDMAKSIGANVVYFRGGNLSFEDGDARGVKQGNTIYVRLDDANYTPRQIATHEIAHVLISRGEYDVKKIRSRINAITGGKFEATARAYAEAYAIENYEMSAEEIWEEIICDSLANVNIFAENSENGNTMSDVIEGVKEQTKKAKPNGTRGSPDSEVKRSSAFDNKNESINSGGNDVKKFFAGPKSKTANLSLLQQAEKMQFEGLSEENILKQTGWIYGADEKWKYEISDKDMIMIENPLIEKHGVGEDEYYVSTLDNIIEHDRLFEAYPELKDYTIIIQETNPGIQGSAFVNSKQIVLNKNLFRRYTKEYKEYLDGGRKQRIAEIEDTPEYKEYNKFYEEAENDNLDAQKWLEEEKKARDKFYNSDLGKEYYQLNWGNPNIKKFELGWDNGAKKVLIHEIQHAIQNIEGFAKGSNIQYWKKVLTKQKNVAIEQARNETVEALSEIDKNTSNEFSAKVRECNRAKADGDFELYTTLFFELTSDKKYGKYFDNYMNKLSREYRLKNDSFLKPEERQRDASDLYKNTAGEIEARDVESRINMTDEERRNTFPESAKDNPDMVFAEDSGVSYYSATSDEGLSIKEQLKKYATMLNDMKPVFDDNVYITNQGKSTNKEWILNLFEKFDYEAEREDIGIIKIDKKRISKSLRYIKTDGELAAYSALPYVLKQGKIFGTHENHKGRGYNTYTIMAPVVINGIRGNMGAVVRLDDEANAYKVHRILMPDGGEFVYENKKDSSERAGASKRYEVTSPTDTVNDNNISQDKDVVNTYSMQNSENDVKKSRVTEAERLKEDNENLRTQLEQVRSQMERMKTPVVYHKDVSKLAGELIKEFGTTIKASDILDKLTDLGNYMLKMGDGKDVYSYDTVKYKASQIAVEIIDNVKTETEEAETYKAIRKYFKDTPITITNKGDFADYESFRKSVFGKLRLVNNGGSSIDTLWGELNGMYGENYFPSDITAESDMILHIVDYINDIDNIYYNPYDQYRNEAIEEISNMVIAGVTHGVRSVSAEDAVELEGKLSNVQKRLENAQKKLSELKNKQAKAMAEYQRLREAKERKAVSDERARLLKIAQRLNNRKLPTPTKERLQEIIGELDLSAVSILKSTRGKLEDWADRYRALQKDNPDFEPNDKMENFLLRLGKKQIKDIELSEVRELTQRLLALETEIANTNRLIKQQGREAISLGIDTIHDIRNAKGSKDNKIDKYITVSLTPNSLIKKIVGYNENSPLYKAFKALEKGESEMFAYRQKAYGMFLKFTKNKDFMKSISGKKSRAISITGTYDGKSIDAKITPAMLMSLYMHSQNGQNMQHIKTGGIVIPNYEYLIKGDMEKAWRYTTTLKLSYSQIIHYCEQLTDEEKAFCNKMRSYFEFMSKEAINEVSNQLKGYDIATVKNYFPLAVDENFLKTNLDSMKCDGTIPGMGFLQDRQVDSNKPIYLYNAQDVLTRCIDQHSQYVGLAIPVRDFNKLMGISEISYDDGKYKAKDEFERIMATKEINFNDSVQKAIKEVWGQSSLDCVVKILGDIQNPFAERSRLSKTFNKIKGNYARAMLTYNAGVAMKQEASFPTAIAETGYKAFLKGLPKRANKTQLEKNPRYWYRSQGFANVELGELSEDGKEILPIFNWVQGTDLLTVRNLFPVAEEYVKEYRKDLSINTKEYWEAVQEKFSDIIKRTQPNYSTLQRPDILRDKGEIVRILTMFTTQPLQNFNILYDATGTLKAKRDAYHALGTEESKQEFDMAKKRFVWAYTSQALSSFVFALIQYAWYGFRKKDDKYRDENGNLTFLSWTKQMGIDMLGTGFGMLPFGNKAYEFIEYLTDTILKVSGHDEFFGSAYYGLSDPVVDTVSNLTDSLIKITKTSVDFAKSDEKNYEELARASFGMIASLAVMAGRPVNNVKNLFEAFAKNIISAIYGKDMADYYNLRLDYAPNKEKAKYYDIAYRAYESGNEREYKKIVDNLIKSGMDEDAIIDNMATRIKDSDEGKLIADVSKSELYKNADENQRDDIDKMCNKYLKAIAKSTLTDGLYQPDSWIDEAKELSENNDIPVSDYIVLYAQCKGIKSINGISYSKGVQQMQVINQYTTDKNKRNALYDAFDIPKGVRRYTDRAVDNSIKYWTKQTETTVKTTSKRDPISVTAATQLGARYTWGGTSPNTGFDCSGLVQYAYKQNGVNLPRTAAEQFKVGTSVDIAELEPGDLVFFKGANGSYSAPGHVGIYIGNDQFIEAPQTGYVVRVSKLSGKNGFVGAKRVR